MARTSFEISGPIDTSLEALLAIALMGAFWTLMLYAAGAQIRAQLQSPRNWDRNRGSH